MHNLTGQVFGRLTAVSYQGNKRWLCKCVCGNTCIVSSYLLRKGATKSCSCLQREARFVDYTGKIYGRLTCVGKGEDGKWKWQCQCGRTFSHSPKHVVAGLCVCCPDCAKATKAEQANQMREHIERTADGRPAQQIRDILEGKLLRNNSSGIRGVSWHKGRKRWVARVQSEGRTVTLGYYTSLEEAKRAREDMIHKLYSKEET